LNDDQANRIRKPRVVGYAEDGSAIIESPLRQLDGGQWATDELNDTSELRAKIGATKSVVANEPRGYQIAGDGSIVTGDNATV